jgi:hypothetical protein
VGLLPGLLLGLFRMPFTGLLAPLLPRAESHGFKTKTKTTIKTTTIKITRGKLGVLYRLVGE